MKKSKINKMSNITLDSKTVAKIKETFYKELKDPHACILRAKDVADELLKKNICRLATPSDKHLFSPAAVSRGLPDISAEYATFILAYIRRNMLQLDYNEDTGMYDTVIFAFGCKIYFMSVKTLGIYSYNPYIRKNCNTDNISKLCNWNRVELSVKATPTKVLSRYLRINFNVMGFFNDTLDLLGNPCEQYLLFNKSVLTVAFHRLVYFAFNYNVNLFKYASQDVNHMLAGSNMYLDILENDFHFGEYYDNPRRTYAELACHPYLLETCTKSQNVRHGYYTMNFGFRSIPVSVKWIPDDFHSYDADIPDLGKGLLCRVLDELEFGYFIKEPMCAIMNDRLKRLSNI